jgi:anaerobic magnesium-protoporphyrin IX monomethyl ester cyclase
MKTWICNIICNFYGPLLGAARVYSYVKKQGHDISFKDLNQDAYFTLLSREYLEPTFDRIRYAVDTIARNSFLREDLGSIVLHSSNNALQQLVARGILSKAPWYKIVKDISLIRKPLFGFARSKITAENIIYALLSEKEFVLAEIEKSRKILDEKFFSLGPEEFLAHFQTLLGGKALIDMAYFPAQIDFGLGFNGNAYNPLTADILRGVEDEKHNFLIPYYRNRVLPMLGTEHPEVVGISITCIYELLPAFTLAHMIKKAAPRTHVVLGGSLATQLAHRITRNPPLWNMFDSLVLGPGEVAFSGLIEQVEKRGDLSAVPNIIYRQKDAIVNSEKTHEFDINEACTPEFVSVRPKSGLPLETSSGCYWGKCIFCYYPRMGTAAHDPKYQKKRVRDMELVLKDIKEYQDKYDPLAIVLTDSSVHPKRLEAIAENNLRNGHKVMFSALFRLENEFLSKAFCRKLSEGGFMGGFVGLESGSQRVNDIVNKGIDIKDIEVILKNFEDTGILIHLFSIVGIPGETKEDAIMTYEFMKRWHRQIKLNWEIYHLYLLENSALAQRAPEFNLKSKPLPDDILAPFMTYQPESGLSQEESVSLSISYTEKLRHLLHPLHQIMDIESMALFLLAQRAKGIMPNKVKKPALK